MTDLSLLTNKQLLEIASKMEKRITENVIEAIEDEKEDEVEEPDPMLEAVDRLINAIRALRTEPSKTIVQPKIVMPEFTPTINVQASEVTVPQTVQVMPSQVNYPARPTKWRFSICRNRFNQIDEITAEAVK